MISCIPGLKAGVNEIAMTLFSLWSIIIPRDLGKRKGCIHTRTFCADESLFDGRFLFVFEHR